jgi:hypothetical protein
MQKLSNIRHSFGVKPVIIDSFPWDAKENALERTIELISSGSPSKKLSHASSFGSCRVILFSVSRWITR